MTKEQIAKLKCELMKEKKEIEDRLDASHHYGLDASMKDSVGELSNHDNHPADMASEMFEREKDAGLKQEDEFRLEEVKDALERIRKGSYGLCEVCHKEIPFERLEALPYTPYCIEHAGKGC